MHAKRSYILILGTFILAIMVIGAALLIQQAAETKIYSSAKLGIQFQYASKSYGKGVSVKETGNTIYVYEKGTPAESGQSITVFTKKQSESLADAVQSQFLDGYDPKKCFIKSGIDIHETKPQSGTAVIIAYPIPNDNTDAFLQNQAQCPPKYSLTNGISYFWTEKPPATKFAFFMIGQYYIPADAKGTPWQDTVRFTK